MRRIAFIGVGNMANAIIGGLLRCGAVDPSHLILCDKFPDKCADYVRNGAALASSPAEAVRDADCVVLSVKPQNFPEVLAELATVDGVEKKLTVTIAAGITVEAVRTALHGAPVVRVLPNTPMPSAAR
jgi:pyrroline-5-carboxylate reductase